LTGIKKILGGGKSLKATVMLDFFKKRKVLVIIIAVVAVAIASAAYFLISNNPEFAKLARKAIPKSIQAGYYCKIDGVKIPEKDVDKKPLAVMVENMSTIRPQSGLSQACMVFEALAEGGITRFLVIYGGERSVKKIGPVRSARPYYVSIADAFNPVYAHCGFSTEGGKKIKGTGIDNFDQFYNPLSFWRDNSRKAPHNLFTSTKLLYRGAKKRGYSSTANYNGFSFKSNEKKNSKKKQVIGINFSFSGYYVSYEYSPETNSYNRFNAHVLQKDANNNKTISPKNVIVIFAPTNNAIGDTLNINVEGTGKALYFIDGKTIKGSWEKPDASTQFTFYDSHQKVVRLNRGQTWVEVVKNNTEVTF
jgi:hypothetical protein